MAQVDDDLHCDVCPTADSERLEREERAGALALSAVDRGGFQGLDAVVVMNKVMLEDRPVSLGKVRRLDREAGHELAVLWLLRSEHPIHSLRLQSTRDHSSCENLRFDFQVTRMMGSALLPQTAIGGAGFHWPTVGNRWGPGLPLEGWSAAMTKVWWEDGQEALTLALALLEGNEYPAKHRAEGLGSTSSRETIKTTVKFSSISLLYFIFKLAACLVKPG